MCTQFKQKYNAHVWACAKAIVLVVFKLGNQQVKDPASAEVNCVRSHGQKHTKKIVQIK